MSTWQALPIDYMVQVVSAWTGVNEREVTLMLQHGAQFVHLLSLVNINGSWPVQFVL